MYFCEVENQKKTTSLTYPRCIFFIFTKVQNENKKKYLLFARHIKVRKIYLPVQKIHKNYKITFK